MKNRYVVLDRAVEKIQTRLNDLKVWSPGQSERGRQGGRVLHQGLQTLPKGFSEGGVALTAGEPEDGLLCVNYTSIK